MSLLISFVRSLRTGSSGNNMENLMKDVRKKIEESDLIESVILSKFPNTDDQFMLVVSSDGRLMNIRARSVECMMKRLTTVEAVSDYIIEHRNQSWLMELN